MDAQGAAERAVAGSGSPAEALVAIEGALDLMEPPEGLSDRVCRAAMLAVLDRESPTEDNEPTNGDPDTHIFESVALAWMRWLHDRDVGYVREEAIRLRREQKAQGREGAIHRMALLYWLDAVELLADGDTEGSRRVWQRALEVGGSFGTESHPVVLWSYIASFFPRETPRAPGRKAQGSAGITSGG